jgi:predicted aldo/keto reductase-like oxidoreductase
MISDGNRRHEGAGAGMLSGFGKQGVAGLPGAAIRYLAQDERVHMLTIGMRSLSEIDTNIKVFAGDATYTNEDRALLAGVSAAVLSDDNGSGVNVKIAR